MYPDCWESWFELYEMAYFNHENSREVFFELWDERINPFLDNNRIRCFKTTDPSRVMTD